MFAAFPYWYATLFSGFYLPLLLILAALIVRGVAFEYRGKIDDARWRRRWDACIVVGSLVPALLWGVAFANIVRGVPIDADGNYTGTLFTLLNPFGLLGGLTMVALFCTYGAIFVALKTVGTIRADARSLALASASSRCWPARPSCCGRCWPTATRLSLVLAVLTAAALVAGLVANAQSARAGPSAWSAAGIVGVVATLFVALYPDVMPSSTEPGVQPDHRQRQLHALHPGHHVLGRAGHAAVRARLPGVDLLGVPQAHRARQHPDAATARRGDAARHVIRPRLGRREPAPLDPRLLRYSRSSRPFLLVCVLLGLLACGRGARPGGSAGHGDHCGVPPGRGPRRDRRPSSPCSPGSSGCARLLAYAQETAAARAAATVKSQLRTALLRQTVALGPS